MGFCGRPARRAWPSEMAILWLKSPSEAPKSVESNEFSRLMEPASDNGFGGGFHSVDELWAAIHSVRLSRTIVCNAEQTP